MQWDDGELRPEETNRNSGCNDDYDLTDGEIEEGAEMIAYHKHPKDDKLWTFPDGYTDDEEVETPYMSNASMRNFLDELGYDPNFEDAGPVPAKEFIARTTQWLQKHIGKWMKPRRRWSTSTKPSSPRHPSKYSHKTLFQISR